MSYTKGIFLQQGLGSVQTVSSGGSLSNGALVAANGAANLTNYNSGTGSLVGTWSARLNGGFGSAPTALNNLALYLAPILDGTNGTTVDTSTPVFPSGLFAGYFIINKSQTGAQYMDIDPIPFPLTAYDYIPYIGNNSGQTLSATWTLTFYPTAGQYS